MSKNWRYIPLLSTSGPENMAIDEYLLDAVGNKSSSNSLRFYKWTPSAVSIGYHQSLSAEININRTKDSNIDIIRRISGGGAVFHDEFGEITYALICRLSDLPKDIQFTHNYDPKIPFRYQVILETIAQGIESLGINIDSKKIHCPALMINHKKISGNAQVIRKGVLLQHGTILLHVHPELMYSYLKASTKSNYTKMIKSVRSHVMGLFDEDHTSSFTELNICESIKNRFEELWNIEFHHSLFTNIEKEEISLKKKSKYCNFDWTNKYP